jgi:hypothetical protein
VAVLLLLLLAVLVSLREPPSTAASASRRSMKLLERSTKLRPVCVLDGGSSGACCSCPEAASEAGEAPRHPWNWSSTRCRWITQQGTAGPRPCGCTYGWHRGSRSDHMLACISRAQTDYSCQQSRRYINLLGRWCSGHDRATARLGRAACSRGQTTSAEPNRVWLIKEPHRPLTK